MPSPIAYRTDGELRVYFRDRDDYAIWQSVRGFMSFWQWLYIWRWILNRWAGHEGERDTSGDGSPLTPITRMRDLVIGQHVGACMEHLIYRREWERVCAECLNGVTLNPNRTVKNRTKVKKQLLDKQSGKCNGCQKVLTRGFHIDHIMPVSLGGSNDHLNLQLLCPCCNLRKGAQHPNRWSPRRQVLNAL